MRVGFPGQFAEHVWFDQYHLIRTDSDHREPMKMFQLSDLPPMYHVLATWSMPSVHAQSNSCSVDTCCCLIEIIYLEPLIKCLVQKNVAGVGGQCSRQWTSIAVHKSIKSNKSIGSTTESIKYSLDVFFIVFYLSKRSKSLNFQVYKILLHVSNLSTKLIYQRTPK